MNSKNENNEARVYTLTDEELDLVSGCLQTAFLIRKSKKPLSFKGFLLIAVNYPIWWTFRDSNPGPTGYEPGALTN